MAMMQNQGEGGMGLSLIVQEFSIPAGLAVA